MRFETTKGMFITADTKADAARMAAQYNMGDIARVAQAAPSAKKRRPMSVATALRIYAQAQEWPQCGQRWPIDARQRAAQEVIAANPGCTDCCAQNGKPAHQNRPDSTVSSITASF